jgi:hypothetical protein
VPKAVLYLQLAYFKGKKKPEWEESLSIGLKVFMYEKSG